MDSEDFNQKVVVLAWVVLSGGYQVGKNYSLNMEKEFNEDKLLQDMADAREENN